MAKKNFSAQSEEKITFGKLISDLRIKKGLSLRKFANAVGLPPSNMTYMEKGASIPTAEIYTKMLNILYFYSRIKMMDYFFITFALFC